MKSKKIDPERSKVLQSISGAAQLISKNDGNRETTDEDIINAVKRELKMATQSKESGAPFNKLIFSISEEFLPKIMTEEELTKTIEVIINDLLKSGSEKNPRLMGNIMKVLKTDYKDLYDGKMASQLTKKLLN
jgi:uncharacterized protein YqeY